MNNDFFNFVKPMLVDVSTGKELRDLAILYGVYIDKFKEGQWYDMKNDDEEYIREKILKEVYRILGELPNGQGGCL